MSILDSFFFILRADTTDAVRGLNRAGQGFDDLRDGASDASRDVSSDVSRMGGNVARAAEAAGVAVKGFGDELRDLAKDAAIAATGGYTVAAMWERIQRLSDTATNARSLNIPIEQYDTLQKVLLSAGYEAEETRDLFVDLAEAVGEGAGDAESQRAKTFKELGVALKDGNGNIINATTALQSLSSAVDGLSPEKAIFMLRQLGINDPKLLTLLTQGNAEMKKRIELVRSYGVMNESQAKAAMELQTSQQRLMVNLASIGESVARGILPVIAATFKALNAIIDYVNEHRIAFSIFFGAASSVITLALLPSIWSLVSATGAWAAATVIATWPWLALAAAVAAVALVAEDVYLYFTDPTASTVTGELVKKFPELGKVLTEVRDQILWMRDAFIEVKDGALQTFDDLVNYINSLNPELDKLVANAKNAFTGLFNWFRSLGLEIGDFFRDLFAGIVNSIVDSVPEAAQKALGITRMRTGAERRLDVQTGDLAGDVAAITAPATRDTKPGETAQPSPTKSGGVIPEVKAPGSAPETPVTPVLPNVSSAPAAASAVIAAAGAAPINSMAGTNTSVSTKVVETHAPVHIERLEVHTQSTDPAAINEAVTGGIGEQWKNTVAQHDDGISH